MNDPRIHVEIRDRDLGWMALYELTRSWSYTVADVGVLESEGRDVVFKAAINELGGEQQGSIIPARPFMSWSFDQHKPLYEMGIEIAISEMIGSLKSGAHTAIKVLERGIEELGGEAVEHMIHAINNGPWKPNHPYTVRKKGFDKPLYETGELRASIDVRVSSPSIIRKEVKARKIKANGRPRSIKKRLSKLKSLSGPKLYEGQGTRNAPGRRKNAAKGTASKGVRRSASTYPSQHSATSTENRSSGLRRRK
jgi:hypothetical protein